MEEKGILRGRGRPAPQAWTAFFSALAVGFAAHGMGLWNKLSSHDDIVSLFWEGSTISSGRWMLHVVGWLEGLFFGNGHFSLPAFNGLIALLCIGAAAGMLVQLLSIRRKSLSAGLGALMAAFPTVAGLFGYMFTVHYYMLAMGMTVAGGFLLCRGRRWWTKAAAVALGGCAMGIYQAFFPMLLSMLLLDDLGRLARGKEETGAFLKRLGIQAFCVLATVGFYFAMNALFLRKYGLESNSYMGIDRMGAAPPGEYLARAAGAWKAFFLPAAGVSADMYPRRGRTLYLIMVGLDVLLGTAEGIRAGRKNRAQGGLYFLLLLLFPLANDFVYVMSDTVHGLMTFSLAMQFALFASLADRADFRPILRKERAGEILRRAFSGGTALLMGLMGAVYVRFDNQCYLKATFQQQQAISFFTVLAARIKGAPDYRDDMPVVFLNEQHIADETLNNLDELDFIHLDPYGETLQGYVNSYAWRAFMERWCGFAPAWGDPADYTDLPEVQTMPHYPADGSIRRIGDAMVVQF